MNFFLNPILLWGAAAVSIPVLIHLFNKNRYRIRQWGAMHLIEQTIRVQKRRLRIENWLLLLLRMMIPLLLALCLARPRLTGTSQLLGDAEMSLIVMVDDSYSLEYNDKTKGRLIEDARGKAVELVGGLKKGSNVQVIRLSGGPLFDSPRSNLKTVGKDLANLKTGFGMAKPAPAFKEAATQLVAGKMKPVRDVVMLTDFQRVSWTTNSINAMKQELSGMGGEQDKPSLTMIHVGAGEKVNISVDGLDYSELPLAPKEQLKVRASVKYYGNKPRSGLPLEFRVDGKPVARYEVKLEANATESVKVPDADTFTAQFDDPGTHVIAATAVFGNAEQDDRLRADDTYLASVEVWDNVPVLILDGQPSAKSLADNIDLEGESDFLRLALQPFAEVAMPGATDLIDARVIDAATFDKAAIGDARVIIMTNVPRLDEAQTTAIKQYVKQGGGLMIFLGDQVDAQWYNATLGDDGFLPAKLDTIKDLTKEKVPFTRVSVDPPDGRPHRVMRMFAGEVAITARVKKWYRLNRPLKDPSYEELAALNTPDRDSYLLSRKVSDGRVLLCTSTCDEDWFSGIGAPFYVPLMQRLTVYLASSVAPRRNLTVGEAIVERFPKQDIDKEVTLAFYPLEVVTPDAVQMQADGERLKLKINSEGGRGVVFHDKTQQPGLYVLKRPDGKLVHYSVTTDRQESDLAQLSTTEIEQLANTLGARLVTDVDEYQNQETKRRHGQEIWKWLMAGMLALCIGELLLVQHLSRNKA